MMLSTKTLKTLAPLLLTLSLQTTAHSAPLSSLAMTNLEPSAPIKSPARQIIQFQTAQTETAQAQNASPLPQSTPANHLETIIYGKTLIGIPYKRSGNNPQQGFDCSGFIQHIFKQSGINLPRTSRAQYQALTKVSQPQIGDLVFFRHGKTIDHVGIYLGNHKMLHAPSSGKQVEITSTQLPYWQKRYAGARRVPTQAPTLHVAQKDQATLPPPPTLTLRTHY